MLGGAFKWYRNLFFNEKTAYDSITRRIPVDPTNIYFMPFLTGKGTPEMKCEQRAAFFGLSLETDKYVVAKAIQEGITMELLYNMNVINSITKTSCGSIAAVGGATKSDAWMQLKANITGSMFERYQNIEAGTVGAAMLGGVGCGIFDNIKEANFAFNQFIKKKTFYPIEDVHSIYFEKYKEYCKRRYIL